MRIFDLVPAIDLHESLAANETIASLHGCGNNIFAGSTLGRIILFSIGEQEQNGRIVVDGQVWAQCQLPPKLPISQISSASALNTLLVLSAGTLYYLRLQDLQMLGASTSTNITCFSLNCNPLNDDPFKLQIAIGTTKKHILLCEKLADKLSITSKLSLDSPALVIAYDAGCICYGTQYGYAVYSVGASSSDTSTPQWLFPIDSEQVTPLVERIGKEEFILTGMHGLGMFATGDGVSSLLPVLWDMDDVRSVCYVYPYLLALGDQFIAIHSVIDQQLKQRIPFADGVSLGNFDGQIFVASRRHIYKLCSLSWYKQVDALLDENMVNDALKVAETWINRIGYDEKQLMIYARLKQRASFALLAAQEFDEARRLMIESELDPRELIALYPDMLPSTSQFTRSYPPLHSFVDISSMSIALPRRTVDEFLWQYLNEIRLFPWSKSFLTEVDTALLKLAAEMMDALAFERFVIGDECRQCDVDDCEQWLKTNQHHHYRAVLLVSRHRQSIAWDIWHQLCDRQLNDRRFPGFEYCLNRLRSLENELLIETVVSWMLPVDADAVVEQMIKSTAKIDEQKFALLFESYPSALLKYLDSLVNVKQSQKVEIHTRLALLYIEMINELDQSNESRSSIDTIRHRFRTFLLESNLYNVDKVETEMQGTRRFASERALILGKNGSHAAALRVLVDELGDLDGAEQLCHQISAKIEPRDRRELYFSLIDTYLHMHRNGSNLSTRMLNVLNDARTDVDLERILDVIPADWSLTAVAQLVSTSIERVNNRKKNQHICGSLANIVLLDLDRQCKQRQCTSFRIDERTLCTVCGDSFIDSNGCRHPDGAIMHTLCAQRYRQK